MKRIFAIIAAGVIGIIIVVVFTNMQKKGHVENIEASKTVIAGVDRNEGGRNHPMQEDLARGEIIRLTNETRSSHGLEPLAENRLLNAVAEERVRDMFSRQYIDHVSPTGDSYTDVAQRVGYRYRRLSENIGSGLFLDNQRVINGWMQSPGHRQNLLSIDVNEIGAAVEKGIFKGAETWIAVQIFGLQSPDITGHKTTATCSPPSDSMRNAIERVRKEQDDAERELLTLRTELNAEKAQIDRDRRPSQEDVTAYNVKAGRYNQQLGELKGKKSALRQMIGEYNREIETYNRCVQEKTAAKH